jgi:hypothetical protein
MSELTTVNAETIEAVQKTLRKYLDRYGFERADVHEGRDHSGDPALFVDAFYRVTDEPLETIFLLRTLTELRNTLIHMGESRFPHVKHHFDDKQKVANSR